MNLNHIFRGYLNAYIAIFSKKKTMKLIFHIRLI